MRARDLSLARLPPPPDLATQWPVLECRVNSGWRATDRGPAQVLVARRSPESTVAAACYLVDLACLGAKSAFLTHVSERDYASVAKSLFPGPSEVVDLALAAAIVRTGIAYADSLGLRPHPDAAAQIGFLGPELPCDIPIPTGGPQGKPYYVQGPDDDARAILRHLLRRLGPTGFHFIAEADVVPGRLRDGSREVTASPPPTRRRDPNAWF